MSNELYQTFPKLELEYRLYYDTTGKPIAMSSHNHPTGQYIVISKDQYDLPNYNCRVVNGKLVFDTGNRVRVQLHKSDTGVAVVKGYAALVVEEDYPEIEYYDRIS
jgi:hypothetical protein